MRWKSQSAPSQIIETGQREGDWHYTTISLANTDEMITARYVVTADPAWQHDIQFYGHVGNGDTSEQLIQAILAHYAHPEVDTLSLHIPPGTCKQFRLRWRTISRIGRISFGHHKRWVRYRCPTYFELELLGATYHHDQLEFETPAPLDPALSLTYVPLTIHIFGETDSTARAETGETTTLAEEQSVERDHPAREPDTTPISAAPVTPPAAPITPAVPITPTPTEEAADLLAGGNEMAYAEPLPTKATRPSTPIPPPSSSVDWDESTSTEVAPLFPEGFPSPQSPQPEPERETGTQPEPERETGTQPEPERETRIQPAPERETGTQPAPERETRIQPAPERETRIQPAPERETGTQPEPERETGTQPELEPLRRRDQIAILVMGGLVLLVIITAAFLLLPSTETLFSTKKEEPTPTRMPPPDIPTDIPILLYHHIREEEHHDDSVAEQSVAPDLFAEQMAWLDEQEYTTLRISDLVDCLQGKQPCPERPVVLTFDGGYEESVQAALPILKRHGFVATWYIPVGLIDTPGYVSWEQLEMLRDQGMEIGAAAVHARDLRQQTAADAQQEIVESRAMLAARLDIPIDSFAYPDGKYTQEIVQMVRDAGYSSAVTTVAASMVGDIYELPRRRILGGEPLSAFIWYVKPLYERDGD